MQPMLFPSRLWVFLSVFCIFAVDTAVKAFLQGFSQTTTVAIENKKIGNSMARAMTAPQHTTTLSNWRVLTPLVEEEKDSASKIETIRETLRERAHWSDQQYHDALELYDKFISCTDSYVAPGIHDALNCLDHAYRLYGAESVINSFNGGKDAVVILHLLRAAHAHRYRQLKRQEKSEIKPIRPRTIYFEHEDEFSAVLVRKEVGEFGTCRVMNLQH